MAKAKVAVVVDSTANIPPDLVQQYHIHVIPQTVNWEDKSYLEDVTITAEEFYTRLPASKVNPTTSQPSAGEFYEFFSKVAETAESIVAIHISEYLSGTLSSARTAVEMMGGYPMEIVDSRSASMGLGLITLAAARAAAAGQDYQSVAALARSLVPKTRVVFVVDTLEYLHRGGRIGGAKRLIGSMLSVKPLLHLADGRIEPMASVRTKKKAVQHMLDTVQQDMGGKSNIHLAVLHAAAAEEAAALAATLRSALQPVELAIGGIGPVIGTHVGPGTLGVAYYSES